MTNITFNNGQDPEKTVTPPFDKPNGMTGTGGDGTISVMYNLRLNNILVAVHSGNIGKDIRPGSNNIVLTLEVDTANAKLVADHMKSGGLTAVTMNGSKKGLTKVETKFAGSLKDAGQFAAYVPPEAIETATRHPTLSSSFVNASSQTRPGTGRD